MRKTAREMQQSIRAKILHKKKEILKKQKEIDELKQDILSLEILEQEMYIPQHILQGECFIVPKYIIESYLESVQ